MYRTDVGGAHHLKTVRKGVSLALLHELDHGPKTVTSAPLPNTSVQETKTRDALRSKNLNLKHNFWAAVQA